MGLWLTSVLAEYEEEEDDLVPVRGSYPEYNGGGQCDLACSLDNIGNDDDTHGYCGNWGMCGPPPGFPPHAKGALMMQQYMYLDEEAGLLLLNEAAASTKCE